MGRLHAAPSPVDALLRQVAVEEVAGPHESLRPIDMVEEDVRRSGELTLVARQDGELHPEWGRHDAEPENGLHGDVGEYLAAQFVELFQNL